VFQKWELTAWIHDGVQAPLSEYADFVVIDTNILLHNLEVLQQFVEDIEKLSLPTIILVPGIVIHELDR
jgi:rRNA-processing protein FCF1